MRATQWHGHEKVRASPSLCLLLLSQLSFLLSVLLNDILHKEQNKVAHSLTVYLSLRLNHEPQLKVTVFASALRHRPPNVPNSLAGEEAASDEGLAQGSLI